MEEKLDFPSHTYYKILNKLGQGGFGSVYKVLNKDDNKHYVIKTISIKGLNNKEIENIKNEAKILSSIDNENIVKYYDSFIENDCFNIVMELCEGLDFRNFINYMKQTGEYINESIIYFFIKRICLGLKEIHKKNLIHRDLKPENIFLTVDIKVKIGDFGISKQLKNGNDFTNTQIGTPLYMAPEILRGEKYNNKVDIWSLGCIIYELCTSNYYFENKNQGKINLSIYRAELQNLIDTLLKKDYNERPNIEQVLKIVEEYINKKDEKEIIKKIEKTETCLNFIIERIIIKSLDKVKLFAMIRESKYNLVYSTGLLALTLSIGIGSFFFLPLLFGYLFIVPISYIFRYLFFKDYIFIGQNQVIFEFIQSKIIEEILKEFEKQLIKQSIIIYNKENFEKKIGIIKTKIIEKKYIGKMKELLSNNFNVLILGCTNVGKSTLINEFLKLEEGKKAKESEGGPTQTKDFTSYTGKYNNYQYTLFDTNGITNDGKDSIQNKTENTLNEITGRINRRDPNKLIHCVWYCFQGSYIQPSDRDFIEKLLNIYTSFSIPIIFVHTQTLTLKNSEMCKKGLEKYLMQIFNNDKNKVDNYLSYYINILARREEELEKEAYGLDELEKITRREIETKGLKSAYYEYIKSDIIPILITGAFEIIFTGYNMNQLYKNVSEDLSKYFDTIKSILNDKDLNLSEDIKKKNMESLEIIYESFKEKKNKIENNLNCLLSVDKLKKDNKEFVNNIYQYKSEEYKKKMSYKDYCKNVDNLIYNNISKNATKTINNMMNICFNMFILKIIKEGVRQQFKDIEKDVIGEIYHELFKENE